MPSLTVTHKYCHSRRFNKIILYNNDIVFYATESASRQLILKIPIRDNASATILYRDYN